MISPYPQIPLSEDEIISVETRIGITLPKVVRDSYLKSNGGSPANCVLETTEIYTVVSEFLPLLSESLHPAIETYEKLIVEQGILPRNYFPFAVDAGGDYFFVDCNRADAPVILYRHDTVDIPVVPTGLTFEAFWKSLRPESD